MNFIQRIFAKKDKAINKEAVKKEKAELPFFSLSPIDNADPDNHYGKALFWALKNGKEKGIRNIALTGPYGSGKSSILRTFEKKYKDNGLHFLNISLATFKEEKKGVPTVPEPVADEEAQKSLRLIELSILQQIFYHEEDKDIPDSRFKKIKNFPKRGIWYLTIFIFAFVLSLIYQWNSNVVKSALRLDFSNDADTVVHYVTLVILLASGFYLIWKSIRPLRGIQLKKFNVQDLEFGIDESINKSILNDHLDEILYFFEVTKYNVVVIEDLDRFEQTEIFTKLRELNYLINYSLKTKREVVFIYAIRDDKFEENDRTKFFDFIIPVIPVINGSNSSEIFLKIINERKYKIKSELVEDIALFVDDMRLLYNIMNEYFLFSQQLSDKLDQNKLLAMVVYKNLYPNDFVALTNGEGDLYQIFAGKDGYIKEEEIELEKQIEACEEELDKLNSVLFRDSNELRKLYILQYITLLDDPAHFIIDSGTCQFMEMIEEGNFAQLIKNAAKYRKFPGEYGTSTDRNISITFKEVEQKVDKNRTYAQRLKLVEGYWGNKIESLKEEISVTKKRKAKLRHLTIKELIATGSCPIEIATGKQNQLVNILLRSGYIDEQYQDYASIFYEGSITKTDREFLRNVRASIEVPYEYKLEKIDKLVSKIPLVEYERKYIFNYDLLDFLLSKNHHIDRRNRVFSTLTEDPKLSFTFIDSYLEKSKNVKLFVSLLAKNWPEIWKYVSEHPTLSKERVSLYFFRLIECADIADLQKIAQHSDLREVIENTEDFLEIIPDIKKLKNLITKLNVKFTDVLLKDKNGELVDHIYMGNHYTLSAEMIAKIIEAKGTIVNNESVSRNYSDINDSGCKELISYVDDNLNTYIQNVWVLQDRDIAEDEEYMDYLLNEDAVSMSNKLTLIERSSIRYDDISGLSDKSLKQKLIKDNKAAPKWHNVLEYYEISDKEFDENLIGFLNNEANAMKLGLEKIKRSTSQLDIAAIKVFLQKMLLDDRITDRAYYHLVGASPYVYNILDYSKIGDSKASSLVERGTLSLSRENFDMLRSNFKNNLHIRLAERRKSDFMATLSKFELDSNDILAFLNSTEFTIAQKMKIFAKIDEEDVKSNLKLCTKIGQLLISSTKFTVSTDLVTFIQKNNAMTIVDKISLLSMYISKYSKEGVFEILRSWPFPYRDISVKGKRPLLPLNNHNTRLSQLLLTKGCVKGVKEEDNGLRIQTFRK